jgi:hypothetical protein
LFEVKIVEEGRKTARAGGCRQLFWIVNLRKVRLTSEREKAGRKETEWGFHMQRQRKQTNIDEGCDR